MEEDRTGMEGGWLVEEEVERMEEAEEALLSEVDSAGGV